MSLQEKLFSEAMHHLKAASDNMGKLIATSGSWTTKAQIEQQFDYLRQDCIDFAQTTLFIPTHNHPNTTPNQ